MAGEIFIYLDLMAGQIWLVICGQSLLMKWNIVIVATWIIYMVAANGSTWNRDAAAFAHTGTWPFTVLACTTLHILFLFFIPSQI